MTARTTLADVAKALLGLDWSDMDDFAEQIEAVATDDFEKPVDRHSIAQSMWRWAQDISVDSDA